MKSVIESMKALPYLMVWYLNSITKKDLSWKEIVDEFKKEFSTEDYDCLNFVSKGTLPKKELRKKLLATKKENIGLEQKLNDSFEEIIETDVVRN